MRGTAWVNTFQTLVFMTLGGITFFVITHRMGGFANAISKVDPGLLMQAEHIKPLELLTYLCIPLCVGMFPHIFSHFLTAKDVGTFRYAIILYPLCIAIVWIPSVLLGILGNVDVPDLHGSQANNVLIQMIGIHAPGGLGWIFRCRCFCCDYVIARFTIARYRQHVHTRYYWTLSARRVFRETAGMGRTAICQRRTLYYLSHLSHRDTEHL